MDRLEKEIARRLHEYHNFNSGENMDDTVPFEARLFVWIMFATPLLVYILIRFGRALHRSFRNLLVRLVVNNKGNDSTTQNQRSNTKVTKKQYAQGLFILDLLFCAFCFGSYGLPFWSNGNNEYNFAKASALYNTAPGFNSAVSEQELRECCFNESNSFRGMHHVGHDGNGQNFYNAWLLDHGNVIKLAEGKPYWLNETTVVHSELIDLMRSYHRLSTVEQITNKMTRQLFMFNNSGDFLLDFGTFGKHSGVVPIGFWQKIFNITKPTKTGAWVDEEIKICCVCYPAPLQYGWSSEILALYGFFLLLGSLVRMQLTLKVMFVHSTCLLLIFVLIQIYHILITHRDIYNLSSPHYDMGRLLQSCITVYATVQKEYVSYYLIFAHSSVKMALLYILVLVASVRRRIMLQQEERKQQQQQQSSLMLTTTTNTSKIKAY
jgi:hypothetical protein